MPPAVATLYALDRCGGIPPSTPYPITGLRVASLKQGWREASACGLLASAPWSQPAEEQREKESEREPLKANHIPDNSLKPMS